MKRYESLRTLQRFVFRSSWLQAVLLGLAATGVTAGLWAAAPATFSALESSIYDAWLRSRPSIPATSVLVLVQRDPESESRFGSGLWDRGVLARLVTALHDADAAVTGLYISTRESSPPHLGGAASDALLSEATARTGNVVYPLSAQLMSDGSITVLDRMDAATELNHSGWPPVPSDLAGPLLEVNDRQGALLPVAQQALAVGHTLVIPDADRVFRRVPLSVAVGNRIMPVFGLALFRAFYAMRPDSARPSDVRDGEQVLIIYAGDGSPSAFQSVSFADLWDAVEQGHQEQVQRWVKDKIVLLLPDPTAGPLRQTSLGKELPEGILQAHLLNTIVAGHWPRKLAPGWSVLVPIAFSMFLVWILLRLRGWRGIAAGAGLILLYGLLVLAAVTLTGLILPVVVPLSAGVFGLLGAVAWSHVLAETRERTLERNMLLLQQDLVAVREALVRRENAVEALEEDRDNARAAADVSAALGTQVEEARLQEAVARHRVEELERELVGLRVAAADDDPLGDASLDRLRQECESLGIVTRDPHTVALFRDLKKGARSMLPVLLLGEPGTGKELFARAAHRLSSRSGQAFIAVNMAAISPELFESELFGHAKGSFTGAVGNRRGYFELAQGGTIFLDEIGDLRLDHQAKLLRVLQDKTFYRVGATAPTTVDVRVIAATNRDLQRGVSEGWFREDLYFRLKGLVLHLPALRDRARDIRAIAEHCLQQLGSQSGGEPFRLSQEAVTALETHRWKGNIRELRHCLEQAVALADRRVLTRTDLRLKGDDSSGEREPAGGILPDQAGDAAVLTCLREHRFDMQATARALNWDRSTVTQRLKGLCFQALADFDGDRDKAAQALAGEATLVRTVELKLMDYHGHLLKTIQAFRTADEAIAACRRRFKNLPDRHFRAAERLIRNDFAQRAQDSPSPSPLPDGERVG